MSSERGKFHHEKNNRIWVWNVVRERPPAFAFKGVTLQVRALLQNPSGERLSEQIEPAGKGREGGEGRF